MTITGTGFAPTAPAAVYFGTTPATSVTVVSATTITAESPPGIGAVDVTVITPGGRSVTSPADVFNYTVDGPQVTSVLRYGHHAQQAYLVIEFNGPLDVSPAQNASNYQIVGRGGQRIKVRSAVYNSATDAVTLTLSSRLSLRMSCRLTVIETPRSGLENGVGDLSLDGAGTGQPGSDYVTTLTRSNAAGPASQRPIAAVVKARAKSDIHGLGKTLYRHAE